MWKILIWQRNNRLLNADSSVFLWNEAEDSSIIETTLFLLKSPKPFEYGRLSHYSGNMLGGLIQATAARSAQAHRSGSGSAERHSSRKDIPY